MKETNRSNLLTWLAAIMLVAVIMALMPSMKANAASLKLSKSKVVLYLKGKKTIKLSAKVKSKSVDATWYNSNTYVASVSSSGKVTAKHTGVTWITAVYGGKEATCKIRVKSVSEDYTKCMKAYRKFLTMSYVTYNDSGDRGQADNFYPIDLNGDGMPELLTCVTMSWGDRYYVLYYYSDGKISVGQRLGVATTFTWYSSKKVLGLRVFGKGYSYYHYCKFNGEELKPFATVMLKNGKTTYYIANYNGKSSSNTYGTKVSALTFRAYVDYKKLNYAVGTNFYAYVNTAYNRSHYLS